MEQNLTTRKKADEEVAREAIWHIKENYERLEKETVNQLYFGAEHDSTTGHYREMIWSSMFERIVPKKFVIEHSVFIIDSKGNISREVDLAILDEMYTPYIFKYGELKFIPVEAVAAVVECKSTSLKSEVLKNWTDSIRKLKTSPRAIVRTFKEIACGTEENPGVLTQTGTRPLRILCCLQEKTSSIEKKEFFDVVISADLQTGKLDIKWNEKQENLYQWYVELNHADKINEEKRDKKDNTELHKEIRKNLDSYQVSHEGHLLSLMTFNFQLNQLLMLINNPMLFPHMAYVEMFNENQYQKEEKK